MMKIKTSELTGVTLDWAVAKCEGKSIEYVQATWYGARLLHGYCIGHNIGKEFIPSEVIGRGYIPSTNWEQGGEIIKREKISVTYSDGYVSGTALAWYAETNFFYDGMELHGDFFQKGETPLVAAMRCYVASKLGDEVEIPEELL